MKAKDLRSLAERLVRSDYAPRLEEAGGVAPSARGVAAAAYGVLGSRCDAVRRVAPEDCAKFLQAYLDRFLLEDTKRVLRYKQAGAGARAPLTSGLRGRHSADLKAMSEAAGVVEAVETLRRTGFGSAREAAPLYQKYGLLSLLEAALDRAYYDSDVRPAMHGVPGGVKEMMAYEIDLANIRIIVDLRARGVSPEDAESCALAPARLKAGDVAALCRAGPDTAQEAVARTFYAGIAQQIGESLDAGRRESLEHLVRSEVLRRSRSQMLWFADSLGYVLGYLREAEAEAANLVAIATGKEIGLPESEIAPALCV